MILERNQILLYNSVLTDTAGVNFMQLQFGPKQSNSAVRVLAVVTMMQAFTAKGTVSEAFAEKFGFKDESGEAKSYLAAAVMGQARGQLQLARAAIASAGFSLELQRELERLERLFDLRNIATEYKDRHAACVTPTGRQALQWASEILPEDGNNYSIEAVNEILSEIKQLKAAAASTDINPVLREFLREKLERLEVALTVFPVCGVTQVRKEINTIIGEFQSEGAQLLPEVVQSVRDENEASLLQRSGSVISRMADVADKSNALAECGGNIVSAVTAIGPVAVNTLRLFFGA